MFQLVKRKIHTRHGKLVVKDTVLAQHPSFQKLKGFSRLMPDTVVYDTATGKVQNGVQRSDN